MSRQQTGVGPTFFLARILTFGLLNHRHFHVVTTSKNTQKRHISDHRQNCLPAMNSTKRKFNALLNGIGNKSTTSLSTPEDDDEMGRSKSLDRILKKQRVTTAGTRIIIANSPLAVPSKSKVVHKKSPSHANVTNVEVPTPKYAPWDRAAFLERLSSFTRLTEWMPKPDRANEVEWAKRGWVLQKEERVRCSLCNVEVKVKLNEKEVDGKNSYIYNASSIDKALVDKYVELIITSHDEHCMWRKKGCDDTIFKLPLNDGPITLGNIRQRYGELSARKATLPYDFNIRVPDCVDLDTVMSYLPKKFFTNIPNLGDPKPPPEMTEINKVALKLALFGWQGHTHPPAGDQPGSISCKSCFRTLGLWLFKSKEVCPITGKEIAPATMSCLDVVKEHRAYCPWRNAATQNGHRKSSTSNLAGWEIVQKVLKNEYYLRHVGDTSRPTTAGSAMTGMTGVTGTSMALEDDEEDKEVGMAAREAKDKERWARLRRVKSLFDTKGMKKAAVNMQATKKDIPETSNTNKLLQTLDETSKKMRAMMDKNYPQTVRVVTEKDHVA